MLSHRQLFLNHVAQTTNQPLAIEIAKAKGIYLYDSKGKEYLDLIAGISVSNLGHSHPRILEAIKKQVDAYLHTMVYGEFILSPQVQLAKTLTDHLPDSLDAVYFVNSGSEAAEGAMKLAKRSTKRHKVLACYKSYHGNTQGAMSLISESFFTGAFRPLLPLVDFIEFNKEEDLERIDEETACIFVETVRGEVGLEKPKNNYLKKLRARCDEVGAKLILDEVQVAFGRTGSLFAFEQYDIVPDILMLAKNFGGGMPLGAFVASKSMMQLFTHNPHLGHLTTFGGHPVSCAAGLANLNVLLEERHLIESVFEKEALFRSLLKHEEILELRSAGLFFAVQFKDKDFTSAVIDACIEAGLITDWFLYNDTCMRIAPPLIITSEEIRKASAIILECINKVCEYQKKTLKNQGA